MMEPTEERENIQSKERYVSLEAVLKCVDEDGYDGEYDLGYSRHNLQFQELIREIPTADVRPVVLCRDCKHFNPYPGDCTDGGIEGVCKRHNSIGVLVMDEDFCSDAERI